MDTSPSQFRQLTRHFVGQFLDNDLLSPQEGLQAGFAGALGFLLMLGLFIPIRLAVKYSYPFRSAVERDYASWTDKVQFIALAMIVMAGLALVQWHTLRPDRRDYLILLPLPVRQTTILWAKLAALAWLFGVFAAGLAGFGPIFSLVLFASGSPTLGEVLRWAAAHIVAIVAASGFVFSGVLALHGVLLVLLGPRAFRRVSLWVQSAAIFAVALALLLLPLVTWSTYPLKRAGGLALHAMPTMWFLGIYQTVGGRADPDFRALATLGWSALAFASSIAALTHLAGYRRHIRTTLETMEVARSRPSLRRLGTRLAGVICGGLPHRHAIFSFGVRTLTRSPRHRFIMALALGIACAVVTVALLQSMSSASEGWRPPDAWAVFSIQYALTFFLVGAARFATIVPSELRASWILRLLAPPSTAAVRSGYMRALLWCGVAPLVVALLPIDAALVGWRMASAHAVVGLVVAAILVEIVFFGFVSMPFAAALPPGTGSPRARWIGYWLGLTLYAFALPEIEALALGQPQGLAWLLGVGLVGLIALKVLRRLYVGAGTAPIFEDPPDWEVQRLDLSA